MGLLDGLFGKETIEQLQKLVQEKDVQANHLKAKFLDLERLKAESEKKLKDFELSSAKTVDSLKLLEVERDELRARNAELLKSAHADSNQFSEKLKKAESKVAELNEALARQQQIITALNDDKADAQKELQAFIKTYADKDHEYDDREEKLALKSEALRQEKQIVHEKETELRDKERQLTLFHDQLQKLNILLQEQEADMASRQADDESWSCPNSPDGLHFSTDVERFNDTGIGSVRISVCEAVSEIG